MPTAKKASNEASWTFLSNHAHVLLCIARDAEVRMRDLAAMVGITERAVQRIIDDLAQAGYIDIERDGRRNRYQINGKLKLRHPVEAHCQVAELIGLVNARQPMQLKS